MQLDGHQVYEPADMDVPALSKFEAINKDQVRELFTSMKYTTGPSDPFPSSVLFKHLVTILPLLSDLVNASLIGSSFADDGRLLT